MRRKPSNQTCGQTGTTVRRAGQIGKGAPARRWLGLAGDPSSAGAPAPAERRILRRPPRSLPQNFDPGSPPAVARPSQRCGSSTRSSAKERARARNIGANSHARRPRTGDVLESALRGAQDACRRSGRLFVVPAESGTVVVHRRGARVLAGPHASLIEAKPPSLFRTVAGVISRPGGSLTPMTEWLLPAGRVVTAWMIMSSTVRSADRTTIAYHSIGQGARR